LHDNASDKKCRILVAFFRVKVLLVTTNLVALFYFDFSKTQRLFSFIFICFFVLNYFKLILGLYITKGNIEKINPLNQRVIFFA
jgi:hypothetical protein